MVYSWAILSVFLIQFFLQIVQGYERQFDSPRTCVIGAGYSGLATARHLKEYDMDFTVFEMARDIGGIWHFDPRVGVDEGGIPIISKMYKNLRLNTPYQFSEFDDFPFPKNISAHLSSECLFKYLSSFAAKFGLLPHIQFRSLVKSVKRLDDQWQLVYWKGDTQETVSETCDYIVIATGLFNDPQWPEIPEEDKFQGTIIHSHTYRGDTEVYRNRHVLIVGGSASGLDLSTQISKVASKLIHSHHYTFNLPVHSKNYVMKPDITSFTENGVIFKDGSFEKVDDVIYCTGYNISQPFLDDSSGLLRNGKFILPLYRKIVNIKHPSMFFVGIFRKFLHKLFNIQGIYVASSIAGKFRLPSQDEMMKNWIHEANHVQNIEHINTVHENLSYYTGNMSEEAGMSELALPPVYNSMLEFMKIFIHYDYAHSKDYDWQIVDDNNFARKYVGPKELSCPIE